MFRYGQLTHSQQRKSALLQQSTAHRRALITEADNLRPVAGWVDLGIDVARKARTAWSVLAPLLSVWQARRQESSGFVHKLAEALSLARSLTELWKR